MEKVEQYFEKKRESILEREQIIAPENFVSVFHETKEEFLSSIDKEGLKPHTETKKTNITMKISKKLIEDLRPDDLKTKGISRDNIYAYPYLEHGHGMSGVAETYTPKYIKHLNELFEKLPKYNPQYLAELQAKGINNIDEYIKERIKQYKSECPGEILELKVDPEKCYVGDMEKLNEIAMLTIRYSYSEKDKQVQDTAKGYWNALITLKDFLKYYKKPEWDDSGENIKNKDQFKDESPFVCSFTLIKEAPDNLPNEIMKPEILIPESVPQEHIKIVK